MESGVAAAWGVVYRRLFGEAPRGAAIMTF